MDNEIDSLPLGEALTMAATNHHEDVLDRLIAVLPPNDRRLSAALCAAASAGALGCASVLLKAGADPMQVSSDGSSPLMLASERGALSLVLELIEHDAGRGMHRKNRMGHTALSLAAKGGHGAVVHELLTLTTTSGSADEIVNEGCHNASDISQSASLRMPLKRASRYSGSAWGLGPIARAISEAYQNGHSTLVAPLVRAVTQRWALPQRDYAAMPPIGLQRLLHMLDPLDAVGSHRPLAPLLPTPHPLRLHPTTLASTPSRWLSPPSTRSWDATRPSRLASLPRSAACASSCSLRLSSSIPLSSAPCLRTSFGITRWKRSRMPSGLRTPSITRRAPSRGTTRRGLTRSRCRRPGCSVSAASPLPHADRDRVATPRRATV